jgi:Carboxypeptidase regulatory-like domain
MDIVRRLLLAFALFVPAAAQSFDATLTGDVSDTSRAAVPRVHITVTNLDTGRAVVIYTNDSGGYTAAGLAPGRYALLAEHEGFRAYWHDGIVLQVDQTARVDTTLEVGAVNEKVQVTAEAPLLNKAGGSFGDEEFHGVARAQGAVPGGGLQCRQHRGLLSAGGECRREQRGHDYAVAAWQRDSAWAELCVSGRL